MTIMACTRATLQTTIDILRRGGKRGEERVVLLLAIANARSPAAVVEVYEPDQITDVDYFRLPPATMRSLMDHLRVSRRRIVAQIHTHPGRAYHSDVDAEWAIIRHVGGLSLVLPRFGTTTTPDNFLEQVMTYEYSMDGDWLLCPNSGPHARVLVTP